MRLTRRELLKLGAGAGIFAAAGMGSLGGDLFRPGAAQRHAIAAGGILEVFPTSPLILHPFTDPLPIPSALRPVARDVYTRWARPPGPGVGQQDSFGSSESTHQVWPSRLFLPDPIVYQVKMQVGSHAFTSSQVLPIDALGQPAISWSGSGASLQQHPANTLRSLPQSVVYGFNGTFPGPMINAEYGKPCLLRIENHLDENPNNLDRQDFGSPAMGFLTHLHNGHTACESDGNPNHTMNAHGVSGYHPGQWVDNLYLNWPAGGDDREKQSFLWFHDHYMHHTGADVYKGMVGLYPIYDPLADNGDETRGFRLPGVRTDNPDGTFDVKYDIPLAIYDCLLDDGVTPHQDSHNGSGDTHPEWWGKTYFRHFPAKGFVGDIFTVNGTAYPVLEVEQRKYRLRFLDASVSRIYAFSLMSSNVGPIPARNLGLIGEELQGQYRIPDGQQCMRLVQVASGGGLLAHPIVRDSFEIWPATRVEFIVDFTKYMDGTPTKPGDVIYLTNTLKMLDGLKPDPADPAYKVPVMKIVIGGAPAAPDRSLTVPDLVALRPMPAMPTGAAMDALIAARRTFTLTKGGPSPEEQWVINGLPFSETTMLASVPCGAEEVWEVNNGGGGWVHPMHFHQEEHQVILRNGLVPGDPSYDPRHADDLGGKTDMVNLDPGESVLIFRRFRSFTGHYVAHCHNLAHEDHNMMFGWEITGDREPTLPPQFSVVMPDVSKNQGN